MASLANRTRQRQAGLAAALGLGLAGAVFLTAPLAHAHFFLDAPISWMSQTPGLGGGNPQKVGPCGDEGGGTASGMVTPITPQADGSYRVTLMWHDTVFHPGHYRIALAVNSRSELPPEPVITPTAADMCASAAIQNPPVFPILADNVSAHVAADANPATGLIGNQMVTVTIPANVTCTHCTLQILEFMSSHGAPCFYHHCADISLGAPAGTGGSAGSGSGGRGSGGAGGRSGGSSGSGSGGAAGAASGSGGARSGGTTASGGVTASGGMTASGGAIVDPGQSGGATSPTDSGTGSGGSGVNSEPGGCSCSVASERGLQLGGLGVLLALGALTLVRRRR